MVNISDFPLELVARVFEEMDLENAWTARQVCRRWRDVFEFCAYGSNSNYLQGIILGVDIICGIHSAKGKVLDQHVIHGQLISDSSKATRGIARWVAVEECYEIWPGGRWRKFMIGDVLTDVKLCFSNLPSNAPDIHLQLGRDVTLTSHITYRTEITQHREKAIGVFDEFVISIDTLEEPSPNGRSYDKHSITNLYAPLWQIYALIVHNSKKYREEMDIIRRHYLQTSTFRTMKLKEPDTQGTWEGFGGFYSEEYSDLDDWYY
jgi:hypothetical protein